MTNSSEITETKLREMIERLLGVDATAEHIRARAWRRIREFQSIAKECEADGNVAMAETLRRICHRATDPHDANALIYVAMLAGPDKNGIVISSNCK